MQIKKVAQSLELLKNQKSYKVDPPEISNQEALKIFNKTLNITEQTCVSRTKNFYGFGEE